MILAHARSTLLAAALAAALAACSGGGGGGGGEEPDPTGDPALDVAASVQAPASAAAGATVTVSYTVRNVGQKPAVWSAEVRFGHGTTPLTARAVIDREFGYTALQPGASESGTVELALEPELAGGDYQVTLKVTAGDDGHAGNDLATAALRVEGAACIDDAFEQDDLPELARVLPLGADMARNFCFDGADWGSFEARAGERLSVKLVSEVPVEARFTLVSPETAAGAFWTTDPGVPAAGTFEAPADGTYHVKVSPRWDGFGAGRSYTLAILPPRPDPAAEAVYVDGFHATPAGGVAGIRVDLVNGAFDMAAPVPVAIVLSDDAVLDPGDRELERVSFPAMTEGEWRYVDYLVPIPADAPPGERFVFAIVDPDGALAEVVEENNTSSGSAILLVAPECPGDAFEQDDRPTDAKPIVAGVRQARNHCEDAHDWVSFEAAAGEGFTVELEPSHRPQSLSARVVAPSGVVVAQAEESYGLVLAFTATESGTYRVEAGADYFGDWQDYWLTLQVARPDLTCGSPYVSSTSHVPGGLLRVYPGYVNRSPTPSGPFQIGLYLSRDEVLDPFDLALGEVTIAGAAQGSFAGPDTLLSLPADVGAGAWSLLAMADPANLVPELFEGADNVSPPTPLTIDPLACAPDGLEPDDLPAQARPLPLDTPQLRNHCDDRRDWVSVAVTQGDPLAVRLDQGNGAGTALEVRAADGTTRLASGNDAVFWRADRTGTVLVCAGCTESPAPSAPASYRLTAGLCPPDANEPDDLVAQARPIPVPGASALNGCDRTKDWLVFDAVEGARYTLTVTTTGSAAAPTARFTDATGFPLSVTRGELTAAASGPVHVEVTPPAWPTLLDSGYTIAVSVR
jgi:hypothetical protein